MNLEQYAAQHAQEPQQTAAAQEVLTAEQMDAARLSSLMAQLKESIEEGAAPAAILEAVTGTLFGTSSPEAEAVEALTAADRYPGGVEFAIASIRQRKRLLKQQAKQLEAQARAIAGELEKLEAAERDLENQRPDTALTEVLTFSKAAQTLEEAAALYDRHRSNRVAMGLLYGSLAEMMRRDYGNLDLIQQQELTRLTERVAEAVKIGL